MSRSKLFYLVSLFLGGHFVWKVSVLLLVLPDPSHHLLQEGAVGTRNRPCYNYTGSNSTETVLSIEVFRRLADEAARLFEEHPDEDVSLCPLPGLSREVWNGVRELILRRAWVRKVCRTNPSGLKPPGDPLQTVFSVKNININFCGNPKTGTTTWKSHILDWLQYPTANMNVDRIHVQFASESVGLSRSSSVDHINERRPVAIFVTRHPHERLVSAYRNKIQRDSDEKASFKERLYRTVHGKTLQEVLNSVDFIPDGPLLYFGEKSTTVISFPEFVRYFIKRFTQCGGLIVCMAPYHAHWWPMHINCPPCSIDYDIMAKTESHDSDYAVMQHILAARNLTSDASLTRDTEHKSTADSDGHTKVGRSRGIGSFRLTKASAQRDARANASICPNRECRLNSSIDRDKTKGNVKRYMSQLTEEEKKYLNEVYYYDFLIYGYDPNEYN